MRDPEVLDLMALVAVIENGCETGLEAEDATVVAGWK